MERANGIPRLICDPLQVGRLFIPGFEVRPAEFVKIQFPVGCSLELDRVMELLRVQNRQGPGHAVGEVAVFEWPLSGFPLFEMFYRRRAVDWLRKRTGLGRTQAATLLRQVDVEPDTPISWLAGTPRWMIWLQTCLARGPSVLVFSTSGLDPLGAERALRTVAEQRGDSAAVYLSLAHPVPMDITEPAYSAVLAATPRERQSASP